MGDLLFSFAGRMGRIQYWINIVCVIIAAAGVIAAQQKFGNLKFADIIITTVSIVPLIIYLAGTTRRFQDRERHPLIGYFVYYALPAGILLGAQQVLGSPVIDPETFIADAGSIFTQGQWPPEEIIRWLAIFSAALFVVAGQISLFLLPGTKGDNLFGPQAGRSESVPETR